MSAVTLAFERFGDRTKAPLMVLHGFFASSRNWRQMAKKLSDHYFVYVIDLRNHGASPHAAEMDYPHMVEDLNVFMDQHQLQTAHILGHSMGGKVAMWFALNYPERVQTLMVADISPVAYQHSFDQTLHALKQLPLDSLSNRKQADEFLSSYLPELSYRQFLLQNLQLKDGQYSWRIDLDIFYHNADNIIGFPEMGSVVPFQGDVLFIMGGNSVYTDKQAINACFENAEIIVLEKANHWLHVDEPELFLAHILVFLQKN